MFIIEARNVHQALPAGLVALKEHGVRETSRAGDVLRFPGPVTTILDKPCERVIFHPWRDANPFFHIVEAAWMLAGRNDLKSLTPYVKRMKDFSDDGVTQPGAYGKRWRDWFYNLDGTNASEPPIDQLNWVVKRLRANPNDRRVVMQMWDAQTDINAADNGGADVPCNLSILPWVLNDALHFTIFNRSNDIIWGLYGANAVHFSICLEYLAGRLGLGVGTMTTVSNNFHAYVDRIPKVPKEPMWGDNYILWLTTDSVTFKPVCKPWPLFSSITTWPDEHREDGIQTDLKEFFDEGPLVSIKNARWPWLGRVLAPMALAHEEYRRKDYGEALATMNTVAASDWRLAGVEWIKRRQHAAENRKTAGEVHDILDRG